MNLNCLEYDKTLEYSVIKLILESKFYVLNDILSDKIKNKIKVNCLKVKIEIY